MTEDSRTPGGQMEGGDGEADRGGRAERPLGNVAVEKVRRVRGARL